MPVERRGLFLLSLLCRPGQQVLIFWDGASYHFS